MKNKNCLTFFTYDQLIVNNIHLGDTVTERAWFEENFIYFDGIYNKHFILSLSLTVHSVRKVLFIIERHVSKRLKVILSVQNPLLFTRVRSECYYLVKYGCYYINSRWVGGVLTNFKTLSLKIFPFLAKFASRPKVALRKRVFKKWHKLLNLMEGLRGARVLPSLAFASDLKINPWVFREAFLLLIPTAGLVDSDSPQSGFVTYAIPSNDDSHKSILFFFLIFRNAFLVGRLRRKSRFLFFLNISLIYLQNSNYYSDYYSVLGFMFFFRKLYKKLFVRRLRRIKKKKILGKRRRF
jgi:small subunit ribosomal protein S2